MTELIRDGRCSRTGETGFGRHRIASREIEIFYTSARIMSGDRSCQKPKESSDVA